MPNHSLEKLAELSEGREGYSIERKLHLQKYGEHGTYSETKEFGMGSG